MQRVGEVVGRPVGGVGDRGAVALRATAAEGVGRGQGGAGGAGRAGRCWIPTSSAAARAACRPAARRSRRAGRPRSGRVATVGVGPPIIVGGIASPMCTASGGRGAPPRPTIRLTQPRRSREPGVGVLDELHRLEVRAVGHRAGPTAWTAAISPASHSHCSGASLGCSPNIASCGEQRRRRDGEAGPRPCSTAGRRAGTTRPSPSMPPRKLSTTRTLPPGVAREDAWRTASPKTEVVTPVARRRRPCRPAAGDGRAGSRRELGAALGRVSSGVGCLGWSCAAPHRVMWAGESSRTASSRGIFQRDQRRGWR